MTRKIQYILMVMLLLMVGAGSAWGQTNNVYDLTWNGVPDGKKGSLTYNGTRDDNQPTTLTAVNNNHIERSEITVHDITDGATVYRGSVAIDNTTTVGANGLPTSNRKITITYEALAANQFTVKVATATTASLGSVIYDGKHYTDGATITFPDGSDVATALAPYENTTVTDAAGTEWDYIINKNDDGSVGAIHDITVGGKTLSAQAYSNYYVQMKVDGQTISIKYIGNNKPVTITYEVFCDGEYRFDRKMTGYVGQEYPRIDKDFAVGQAGPFSTLPYGVKVTNYPSLRVMGDATVQLETEYTFTHIPFYPEGTRFTTMKTWYAAPIGSAVVDRTPVENPDRTTPEYAAKHNGAYYLYNRNGGLAIDKETMVLQDTEFLTLDDLESSYAWAMVGNPYKFRLMNRMAGAGKYLKWTNDGNGGGFFTFDEEGSYFAIVYNYSVKPGDYGWAGTIPEYAVYGYAPFVFGYSLMLTDSEMIDGVEHNMVMTITRDKDNNATGITMQRTPMYVVVQTPGTAENPPVFKPGFGTNDITTMKPDCRMYIGALSSTLKDLEYTIVAEEADGTKIYAGQGAGITYQGEEYDVDEKLSFTQQPAFGSFVARSIEGYEGVVSMDHAKREIVVTYLREGNEDYYYVRNCKDWDGFLVDNSAAGYFTPDPRNAALIYPVRTSASTGMIHGKTYSDVESFYILEKGDGYYWTDTDVSMSQDYADKYIFVDEKGVPVGRAELLGGKAVAIMNTRDFQEGSDLSTIIPYSIYSTTASELLVGPMKSEWQLVKYREPKAVSVSIYQSSLTGVRQPLTNGTIRYGQETIGNGGVLYTIEEGNKLPGLIIPVLNPTSDYPSLYGYNLNLKGDACSLMVIYQNCTKIKSLADAAEVVAKNKYLALYNAHGYGFVIHDVDNNLNHVQVKGAWNVDNTDLVKDEYSQPVSLFKGNATWQMEMDVDSKGNPIAYYLKNSATGYYATEKEDGTLTVSFTKSPFAIVEIKDGYFQTEYYADKDTRAGTDLSDANTSIKSMPQGEATQFIMVVPSETTIDYSIESNVPNGGVVLVPTGDTYKEDDVLFYTLPFTEANQNFYLKAIDVTGYTSTLSVSTDNENHTGVITVSYHSDLTNDSQAFLVHGGSDFSEKRNYWNGNTTNVLGSSNTASEFQTVAFEEAGQLTKDYTIQYDGTKTATLKAGTKTYYLKAAYAGNNDTYGKYIGFTQSANATSVSDAAFQYQDTKDMPVVFFEVPGHPNHYYLIPLRTMQYTTGNITLAMAWKNGHALGDALGLYKMGISNEVTIPFELVPAVDVDYQIVITGNPEDGEIRIANETLKNGQVLHARRYMDKTTIRVKPLDGWHYQYKVTDNTIEVDYAHHGIDLDVDSIEMGVLYTLRTTIETEGHSTHGYYTQDNICIGDYDDINEHGIDYRDRQFLWQNIRVKRDDGFDEFYSWSEELGHAVGVSLPASQLQPYLTAGTWKFERTELRSVAPYYTIDFLNYPKHPNEQLGNPKTDGLRVILSSTQHETWTPGQQSFEMDENGHAEGIFLELGKNMAEPALQYKQENNSYANMTEAKAKELGFYWPVTIERATNEYLFYFEETLTNLRKRMDFLYNSTNYQTLLYPTKGEYDAFKAKYGPYKETPADNGLSDDATVAALKAIHDAIDSFNRPDVKVNWPSDGQLLYLKNKQSLKYLVKDENSDSESQLKDAATDQPEAVWRLKHLSDEPRQFRLIDANGRYTDLYTYTPWEKGHGEWPACMYGVRVEDGAIFYDPLTGVDTNVVPFCTTESEMGDNLNAYWGVEPYSVPDGYKCYTVVIKGVPEGVKETARVTVNNPSDSRFSNCVKFAYDGGILILPTMGVTENDFTATNYAHDSHPTITIDGDAATLTVEYTLDDYYYVELLDEVNQAKAMYDEEAAQAISSERHKDPMTYGYPNETAREALKAVVDPIQTILTNNSSDHSYITRNRYMDNSATLAAAVEAYNTTSDVIVPEDYDVITIQGIVDNGNVITSVTRQTDGFLLGSRKLSNMDDEALKPLYDYYNCWVVKPCPDRDGFHYLQSGYGDLVYLTPYGISDVATPWYFSAGTQKGRMSMYYTDVIASQYVETGYTRDDAGNVTRYMGNDYASNVKEQKADRSTDFRLVKTENVAVNLRVEGVEDASLTMVAEAYSGKRYITSGEMIVQRATNIAGFIQSAGTGVDVPASTMAPILQPQIIADMSATFTYDQANHAIVLKYTEDIESFRERMLAMVYGGLYIPLSEEAERTEAVNKIATETDRQKIKDAMVMFFSSHNGRPFTLQNKATTQYLNSTGGANLFPTASSSDNSTYTMIYVGDGTEPLYQLHNLTQGNYVTATNSTRITSSADQSVAGTYSLMGISRDGANYIYWECVDGNSNVGTVLGHAAEGNDVTAMEMTTPVTDNMLWKMEPLTGNTLPVTGAYYYLPGTTGATGTGTNVDNIAVICEVTRNGSQVVLRPLDAKSTATKNYTLTDAKSQTWTAVVLPTDKTDRDAYTNLLEAYYMGTMPTLGAGIGEYVDPNESGESSLSKMLTAAVTAAKTNGGGSGSASFYNTARTNLLTAIASLKLNMPPTGFYRLKNNATGKYLSMKDYNNDVICPVQTVTDKDNDAESIFYFEGTSAVDANNMVTRKLLNYSNGQYLYATNVVCYPEFQSEAHNFTIRAHFGSVGCYSFWYGDTNEFLSCGTGYSSALKAESVNDNKTLLLPTTGWVLEKVEKLPVKVGKTGYASLYLPCQVTVPTELNNKVYKASDGTNPSSGTNPSIAELNLSTVTSVPAGTPVIINRGTEGTEDIYQFTISSYPASLSATKTAGLTGIFATTPKETVEKTLGTTKDIYVMMKGSAGIGFYKDYIGNLNGFKAYLEYPASSSAKAVVFNFLDQEMAIDKCMANIPDDAIIYTFNGILVGTSKYPLRPGSYIIKENRHTRKVRIK